MTKKPHFITIEGDSAIALIQEAARLLESLETGRMMEADEAIRIFGIMDVGSQILGDAARKLKLNMELAGLHFEEVERFQPDGTCIVELRDPPPEIAP